MNKSRLYILIISVAVLFSGCLDYPDTKPKDDPNVPLGTVRAPADFDYATVVSTKVTLTAPDYLSNAVFSLHTYKYGMDSLQFARATFDENGFFQATYAIPAYIDSILVISEYVGLTDVIYIPIVGGKARFDYRGLYSQKSSDGVFSLPVNVSKSSLAAGFTFMGSFNAQGVPSYLAGRDEIPMTLLDDINQSLPEKSSVPLNNPHFIAAGTETNIVLNESADVWVTFVADGTQWRNALGYYTYPVGQPPSSADDISELVIVFPNASMVGSGGGLLPGDKVYLGNFAANTVVAWFLVANGWGNGDVKTGPHGVHYSQPDLNRPSDPNLKPQMVLLYDRSRALFLLGFEDKPRDIGTDDDFNDVIFYASVNPPSAAGLANVQPIIAANDADGDGINDSLDEFPDDANQAFNNFYPSATTVGTLAFEDLWPYKGDYDFNDLVVEYNINLITNAENSVTALHANYKIANIGGSFKNGFAFALPIPSSLISKVENQVMNVGYASLNPNGTESGVNETVIFVIENATPFTGKDIPIIVHFASSVSMEQLGNPPFDPFLVVNGEREREIHLPDMPPTSKGIRYLGMGADNSNPSLGWYYKSKERNLPWAINLPDTYQVPPEKVAIDKVYPKFPEWANSGGLKHIDWYK